MGWLIQKSREGVPAEPAAAKAASPVPALPPEPACNLVHVDALTTAGAVRTWTTAIQQGDEAAFLQFHERYSLRLFRSLLVRTSGNETLAREVLQDVIIKVARRMKAFDDEQQLWNWLTILARNCLIDHCRSRRRQEKLVDLQTLVDHESPETNEDPLAQAIARALESMPAGEAELVRSAYIDGLPIAAIAARDGRSYKAVESHLGRLRHKLKQALMEHLSNESKT